MHLVVERQGAEIRAQLHPTGPAARRELIQDGPRGGKIEPEDATHEILPIAMGKLDGQLGLAEAPEPRGRRDLAEGGHTAPLQNLGEVSQIGLAADKQRIPTEGHTGALGEWCEVGDRFQRQGRELPFGRGKRVRVHRTGGGLCVYRDMLGIVLGIDPLRVLIKHGHDGQPFSEVTTALDCR
jgi:hypothetical protein